LQGSVFRALREIQADLDLWVNTRVAARPRGNGLNAPQTMLGRLTEAC